MSNNFEIAKELLNKNGKITGLASGISMKPLLRSTKDNAVIIPRPPVLKKNDVVLYRKKATNELILHRIIKVTSHGFIIRGDNLYRNETSVENEDIIGVLEGFQRSGKYYECKKSPAYKFYVFYIRVSYPLRFFIHKSLCLCKKVLRKLKIFA